MPTTIKTQSCPVCRNYTLDLRSTDDFRYYVRTVSKSGMFGNGCVPSMFDKEKRAREEFDKLWSIHTDGCTTRKQGMKAGSKYAGPGVTLTRKRK